MTDNSETKHGGARAGSGRKMKWYGLTVAMRIPEIWRTPLQHCMDTGITPIFEGVQNQNENVQSKLESVLFELETVQTENERLHELLTAANEQNARLKAELSEIDGDVSPPPLDADEPPPTEAKKPVKLQSATADKQKAAKALAMKLYADGVKGGTLALRVAAETGVKLNISTLKADVMRWKGEIDSTGDSGAE